jgi:hypothetical protein
MKTVLSATFLCQLAKDHFKGGRGLDLDNSAVILMI